MDPARIAGIVIGTFGALAYIVVLVRLVFFDEPEWSFAEMDMALLIPLIFVVVGLGMTFWPRKKNQKS